MVHDGKDFVDNSSDHGGDNTDDGNDVDCGSKDHLHDNVDATLKSYFITENTKKQVLTALKHLLIFLSQKKPHRPNLDTFFVTLTLLQLTE